MDRPPLAFCLREAIGDRVDRGGVVAEAAVAALHLDVLRARRPWPHANPPGADAAGGAEDRRRWHGGGIGDRPAEGRIGVRRALAAHELVDAPRIRRRRLAAKR